MRAMRGWGSTGRSVLTPHAAGYRERPGGRPGGVGAAREVKAGAGESRLASCFSQLVYAMEAAASLVQMSCLQHGHNSHLSHAASLSHPRLL